MQDETLPDDGPEQPGRLERVRSMLTGAALRAIDACLGSLQGWRNRLAPPPQEDESRNGRSRRAAAVDEPLAAAPPPKRLLRRALVLVACLLAGAGAGSWSAYRGFAELLAARQAVIDYQQEEIELAKKQEAIDLKARAKFQNETAEHRKRLREAQQEIENQARRIEELDQRLIAMKPVAPRAAAPAGVARVGPVAQKTGSCVTGSANAAGHLLDCIDKFNRP